MSCEIARRLVESGESAAAVETHTASCLSCAIGENVRYYEAPAGLEAKIRASLRPSRLNWWAVAAAALLVVSGSLAFELMRGSGDAIETAVLSAHLRSLEGTHLLDVPSSDQHTVKPWFNGKLDFSPGVPSFADFPLLGGRLEYLDGHPAAALVYGRGGHIINLFVWRSNGNVSTSAARDGYHFVRWSSGGMSYWAVSDLNEAELLRFVSLYRANQ